MLGCLGFLLFLGFAGIFYFFLSFSCFGVIFVYYLYAWGCLYVFNKFLYLDIKKKGSLGGKPYGGCDQSVEYHLHQTIQR
jgi:hypothetical protein